MSGDETIFSSEKLSASNDPGNESGAIFDRSSHVKDIKSCKKGDDIGAKSAFPSQVKNSNKLDSTMSGLPAKRQRTIATSLGRGAASRDRPPTSVPTLVSLPPELVDQICGFMDVGTLCTARLVCSHFFRAASSCIYSVELHVETIWRQPNTTLNNFPNLSQVRVVEVGQDMLPFLAQSHVTPAVTHLRAVGFFSLLPPPHARNATGLPLLPLPSMTSLTVSQAVGHVFPFPQTLRELDLTGAVDAEGANLVTLLKNLTSLTILIPIMPAPYAGLSALTTLQRLDIGTELPLIPFVADLTLLTHLQFTERYRRCPRPDLMPLKSLSCLHNLVHLGVKLRKPRLEAEHLTLESISKYTALRSLDWGLCQRPERSAFETGCMAPLAQLSALQLTSYGVDASFLPRFNLERLQDLSLSDGVQLDQHGVVALRRATGLTHLKIGMISSAGAGVNVQELVAVALSHMSQLRALFLRAPNDNQAITFGIYDALNVLFSLNAISHMTQLTSLELAGHAVITNADVDVCLGLKKLHRLSMAVPAPLPPDSINPATIQAMAKLPELRKFDIVGNIGISPKHLTEDICAWLNAARHEKGWPPL